MNMEEAQMSGQEIYEREQAQRMHVADSKPTMEWLHHLSCMASPSKYMVIKTIDGTTHGHADFDHIFTDGLSAIIANRKVYFPVHSLLSVSLKDKVDPAP